MLNLTTIKATRLFRIVCVIHAMIAGVMTLDLASHERSSQDVLLGMTFTVLFATGAVACYLEEHDVR